MRILFLTHCFPPLAVTASHRPYGWARAWAEAGHDVHVVTPQKYAFDGDLGLDLPRRGITVHEPPYAGRVITGPAATPGGANRRQSGYGGTAATGRADPATLSHRGDCERSESAQSIRWSRLKRVTRGLRGAAGYFADPRL